MKQEITHDFLQYETIRFFDEAEIDQSNILKNIVEFYNKSRPRKNSTQVLYKSRESTLSAFKSGILSIKETEGKGYPSDLDT